MNPTKYSRWLSMYCESGKHRTCEKVPPDIKRLYPCECECHEQRRKD